jgi:predicted acyltransferase
MSVDALRGFDMFWIIGADSLLTSINRQRETGIMKTLADQLDHAAWEGFRFYDLIFPLFVFIVGISLVFSLGRTLATSGRTEALKRIVRRSVLLFAIAILYSGGFSRTWPDIRLLGVLNRIALCYFFTSLCFCFFKPRVLVAICAALLVGYWGLMTFVPFPDVRPVNASGELLSPQLTATNTAQLNFASTNRLRGVFEPGVNLSNYLDQKYLPGMKWDKTWDPEGLLSTLPAIATCLLGVFAGFLLQNRAVDDRKKVLWLAVAGVAGVGAGFLWGLQFPVIKKIWTSSYVLVAGGFSALLLGFFYLVVDVWQYRKWCQPFVWIGMNSITVYMANNVIGFHHLAARFAGGDIQNFFDTHVTPGFGDLVVELVGLGMAIGFVYFLYRKRIFLRL